MISIIILILFSQYVFANNMSTIDIEKPMLPNYGYYCGLGITNTYGKIPIDNLDRACQIHDICTTLNLMDCYCNEQLYWLVSNLYANTQNMKNTKDEILRYIYISIAGCPNHDNFKNIFYIGGIGDKGFNYFPIYHIDKESYAQIFVPTKNVYFLNFKNLEDYLQFTFNVYINPRFYIDESKLINNGEYYNVTGYSIIYNRNNNQIWIGVIDITAEFIKSKFNMEIKKLEDKININLYVFVPIISVLSFFLICSILSLGSCVIYMTLKNRSKNKIINDDPQENIELHHHNAQELIADSEQI